MTEALDEEERKAPSGTILGMGTKVAPAMSSGVEGPSPRNRAARAAREVLRPQPRDPADLTGTELLGRYEVLEFIGEGGMALVYGGVHTTIRKKVALKVLRTELASRPDAVARFLQEARAASKIRHPNVVEVSDFGETEDGVVFCVMEYLDGEDLSATVRREGALEWPRVCRIAMQICSALATAHESGVVHRDLKPDNCFRIERGREPDFVKVLDFGIAQVAREPGADQSGPPRTAVGLIAGTPQYMSPEQARGARVDARTDVYALGVMLFELLSGRLPFVAGSAAEILAMQLHAEVPPLRALAPDVPADLEAVVNWALRKNADERFTSMRMMGAAIEQVYVDGATPEMLAAVHSGPISTTLPPALSGAARRSTTPPLARPGSRADVETIDTVDLPHSFEPAARGGGRRLAVAGLAGATLALGTAAWIWGGSAPEPVQRAATVEPAREQARPLNPVAEAAVEGPTLAELPGRGPAVEALEAGVDGIDGDTGDPSMASSGGPSEPEPSAGAPVELRIDANVRARVFGADGEPLGRTGEPLSLPWSDAEVVLLLRRPGYRDTTVRVTPSSDRVLDATLRRKLRGAPDEGSKAVADDGGGPRADPKPGKISEVKNPFDD